MLSEKHDITAAELSKPYEENQIGLRGIVSFAIGLLLLIVITFGLMWALLNVFKNNAEESAKAGPQNPMMMKEIERLPPEPRLQSAPGFSESLERNQPKVEKEEPGAPPEDRDKPKDPLWEINALREHWKDALEHGPVDENGTRYGMSIDRAKEEVLKQLPVRGQEAGNRKQ